MVRGHLRRRAHPSAARRSLRTMAPSTPSRPRAQPVHEHAHARAPCVPPTRPRSVRPARTSAFGPCFASASALRRSPAPATHPTAHPSRPARARRRLRRGIEVVCGGLRWHADTSAARRSLPTVVPSTPMRRSAPHVRARSSTPAHERAPAPAGSARPGERAHFPRARGPARTHAGAPRTPHPAAQRVPVGGSDGGSRWSAEVSDGARAPPPPVGVSERGGVSGKGADVRAPGGWGRVRRCRG